MRFRRQVGPSGYQFRQTRRARVAEPMDKAKLCRLSRPMYAWDYDEWVAPPQCNSGRAPEHTILAPELVFAKSTTSTASIWDTLSRCARLAALPAEPLQLDVRVMQPGGAHKRSRSLVGVSRSIWERPCSWLACASISMHCKDRRAGAWCYSTSSAARLGCAKFSAGALQRVASQGSAGHRHSMSASGTAPAAPAVLLLNMLAERVREEVPVTERHCPQRQSLGGVHVKGFVGRAAPLLVVSTTGADMNRAPTWRYNL